MVEPRVDVEGSTDFDFNLVMEWCVMLEAMGYTGTDTIREWAFFLMQRKKGERW